MCYEGLDLASGPIAARMHLHAVKISWTYQDDQGNYHDAHSFSGSQLLRVARLADQTYSRVTELRQQSQQDAV